MTAFCPDIGERMPHNGRMHVHVHQFGDIGYMSALPLAAGLLVATARDTGCAFTLHTERKPLPELLAAYAPTPEVLAFSLYTWNLGYSFAAAEQARDAFPKALVVCGGPSVPREPEGTQAFFDAHPWVDVVVLGEGEMAFRELLLARQRGQALGDVNGIAFRDGDDVVWTSPRARLRDFSRVGSPFLDGTFDALLDGGLEVRGALIETNRGCPFSCTFCDWGQATASRVNNLPMERIVAELTWVTHRRIPYVYIIDANFGIRKRDVQIVEALGALKATTGFPFYCYFHLTKNADIRNLATVETLLAAGIGCQVAISMQSYDEAVLAAVKRTNISSETFLRLKRMCNARGIPTANELLLGLPEQTCESFTRGLAQALSPFPGDSFFLHLTRLLENAELASAEHRQRFGIETRWCQSAPSHVSRDPIVEEREEIIVATAAMPRDDWKRAYIFGQILSAFYNLRLLDVVLLALGPGWGLNVHDYVLGVVRHLDVAPEGSVCHAINETLERYIASILAGGPLTLPHASVPGRNFEPADGVSIVVLEQIDAFYDELCTLSRRLVPERDAELVSLFELQRLLTPTHARREPERCVLEWAWLTWMAKLERGEVQPELERRPVEVRYEPPRYVAVERFDTLVEARLGHIYARTGGRCVHDVGG